MKAVACLLFAPAMLVALIGCYTNPVTGRSSLILVSQGMELSLGQQSFAEIRKKEKISHISTREYLIDYALRDKQLWNKPGTCTSGLEWNSCLAQVTLMVQNLDYPRRNNS